MTTPTPEQLTKLRVAVAELCGQHQEWRCPHCRIKVPPRSVTVTGFHDIHADGCGHRVVSTMPNYTASHDAIEAAVREWCGDDLRRWNKYGTSLAEFNNDIFIPSLRPEPHHKCLALLRAAGKEIEL